MQNYCVEWTEFYGIVSPLLLNQHFIWDKNQVVHNSMSLHNARGPSTPEILRVHCTVGQIGPLASGQWFFSIPPNCSCNWKCFLGLPQLNKIPKISISGQTFLNPSPLFEFRPYHGYIYFMGHTNKNVVIRSVWL